MSDTISTKKTTDEQILERLQALEVLLMEQRKEIDVLNTFAVAAGKAFDAIKEYLVK